MKFSVTAMVYSIKDLSCSLLDCFAQHSTDGMVGDRIMTHNAEKEELPGVAASCDFYSRASLTIQINLL